MANTPGSDNPFPSVLLAEHVDPANPSAGFQRLFVDTDHLLKLRDSAGTVTTFGASGMADPMTTRGDIIVRNASNVTSRLGRGSASQVLTSDGTDVAWATPSAGGGITRTTQGTTSVGGSFYATRGVVIKKITLATAGLLASINAHAKGDGTNAAVVAGVVYVDSGGNPTNIISAPTSDVVSGSGTRSMLLNSTARWMSWPVGVWLASGDYWIGLFWDNGGTNGFQLAYSSGTGSDRTQALTSPFVPQDSSVVSISTGTNNHSIYADILR